MPCTHPINITIPGIPVPWKAHAGYGRRAFNPRFKEKEYYQWHIKKHYSKVPLNTPICLVVTFYMVVPKSVSKKRREAMLLKLEHHIKKPDVTNLVKFLEDCLKELVFKDDSQVYEIIARKIYATDPRTEILIYPAVE